jgi:hypothetical protein
MNQNFVVAKKCFVENLQLFSNPQTEPEKFNLYNGLASLVEGMEELELKVQSLCQELYQVRTKLGG